MISFQELIEAFVAGGDGGLKIDAPESWAQGRTLYGGLSAALCHAAVCARAGIDKPMKSALVAFVGPSSGELTCSVDVLRQGKSVTTVSADLHGEKGLGTRAIFVYGDERESQISSSHLSCPEVEAPEDCPNLWGERRAANFARNFDLKLAGGKRPMSGDEGGEMLAWVRHATPVGSNQFAALLALADVLPPACFVMMKEGAPVSTVTWSLEFLVPDIEVGNDWFLIRSAAEHTVGGYSSQAMNVWDRQGRPVIASRQNVAVFY